MKREIMMEAEEMITIKLDISRMRSDFPGCMETQFRRLKGTCKNVFFITLILTDVRSN